MDTPQQEAASLLAARGLTLAVAESSAGGAFSDLLTGVPGISKSFLGAVIAYDNKSKTQLLKVPQYVLDHEGAVSAQTALGMASGVRILLDADIGVSETGIAGPQPHPNPLLGAGEGTVSVKPVGTVFVAIVARDGYQLAERSVWHTDREGFKRQTAEAMLDLLLHYLRRGTGSLTTEDAEGTEQSEKA